MGQSLCHAAMPVSCSLVVTSLERADLLALMYVMFSFIFVTFPLYGILDKVSCLIVSILDICLFLYFQWCVRISNIVDVQQSSGEIFLYTAAF